MTSLWVIWLLGIAGIHANSISSPQIRIVDVTERGSETRVFPHRLEYRHPTQNTENYIGELRQGSIEQPFKSYVIYDEYPFRIFKEWKGNADYGKYNNENDDQNYFQDSRGPNPGFVSQQQQQDGHRVFTRGNPTLAYQSIYSNVIRVVENSGQELGFSEDRFPHGQISATLEPPFQTFYPRKPFQDEKNSVNLPPIFIPNERFQLSKFPVGPPKSSGFSPNRDFYNVGMVSIKPSYGSNQGNTGDAEGTPEIGMPNRKRLALCSYIRLNNKKFPLDGGPCGRSEDSTPLLPDEYPDHSGLSDDKLPMEHRRQQAQNKRFRRSLNRGENELKRLRRNSNFGFDSWEYPMGYGGGYNSYFNEYYSGQGGRNGYGNNNNQNRIQHGNRNNNNNNNNNNGYFDSYQSGDNSRGLSSYLSNGGRRYKNRNDNDDDNNDDYRNNYDNDNGDDDYNDDNDNNNNNNDYDSDDNDDNQNGRRRGSNSRRNNNEYSRNRRRNNYNNQDNDYDDNNNNNRNNRNNRNRQNNNNNNNNNNRRNNNNRNRNGYRNNNNNNSGYGNSNGYNSYNGYSSYGNGNSGNGGYGSSYGNNYGSNRYGSSGYGSSNRGYGSSGYGSNNRGYGSSGYGNNNRGYGSSGYGNNNRGYGSSGYGSYGSYGNSGNHGYGGYGSGGGFGFF